MPPATPAPTPLPELRHNTINIDQGCAFGGLLTALRYPERETVSVRAAGVCRAGDGLALSLAGYDARS